VSLPKSFVLSKTEIINVLILIGTILASLAGYLPPAWGGVITAVVCVINMVLRFSTKGEVTLTLPGSLPAVPPILQAGMQAFENVIASLPPDLGPRAFQLIDQAAKGDLLDGTARMEFVLKALQTEFPGIGTNILRSIIEKLLTLKQQGVTPVLSMVV
jgi:hypothetical protein